MNDARIAEFRAFIAMLNEEGSVGSASARKLLELPTDRWPGALLSHPEWLRVGTVRSLLDHSNDIAKRDPARALAVTTFVVGHIHDVPIPPHGRILVEPLEGEAHTAHANALLAAGDMAAALAAVSHADALLSLLPIAAIERANAWLVRARIYTESHRDDEALDLFDECLRVYADHTTLGRYARALAARAILLCDMQQWAEAWHTLHHAEDTVASLHHDEISAELHGVIARCQGMGLPNEGSGISPVVR